MKFPPPHPEKTYFFLRILRRELGLMFKNIKKMQPSKIALLSLYLYYQASHGRFTDFGNIPHRF